MPSRAFLVAALTLVSACSISQEKIQQEKSPADPAPPSVTTTEATVAAPRSAPPAKLGAPIVLGKETPLVELARTPAAFKGQTILTNGTVKAVCQEQGCWMALSDGTMSAMVRMHGHSFFVPKTASGKTARVQGTVVLVKDGKACDEVESKSASIELDATGIELM